MVRHDRCCRYRAHLHRLLRSTDRAAENRGNIYQLVERMKGRDALAFLRSLDAPRPDKEQPPERLAPGAASEKPRNRKEASMNAHAKHNPARADAQADADNASHFKPRPQDYDTARKLWIDQMFDDCGDREMTTGVFCVGYAVARFLPSSAQGCRYDRSFDCYPGHSALAKVANVTTKTVQNSLQVLQARSHLRITGKVGSASMLAPILSAENQQALQRKEQRPRAQSEQRAPSNDTGPKWPKNYWEVFWEHCWRKEGHNEAKRVLDEIAHSPDRPTWAEFVDGLNRYNTWFSEIPAEQERFALKPARWLKEGSWNDTPTMLYEEISAEQKRDEYRARARGIKP
jgi:hypothetical protein